MVRKKAKMVRRQSTYLVHRTKHPRSVFSFLFLGDPSKDETRSEGKNILYGLFTRFVVVIIISFLLLFLTGKKRKSIVYVDCIEFRWMNAPSHFFNFFLDFPRLPVFLLTLITTLTYILILATNILCNTMFFEENHRKPAELNQRKKRKQFLMEHLKELL